MIGKASHEVHTGGASGKSGKVPAAADNDNANDGVAFF